MNSTTPITSPRVKPPSWMHAYEHLQKLYGRSSVRVVEQGGNHVGGKGVRIGGSASVLDLESRSLLIDRGTFQGNGSNQFEFRTRQGEQRIFNSDDQGLIIVGQEETINPTELNFTGSRIQLNGPTDIFNRDPFATYRVKQGSNSFVGAHVGSFPEGNGFFHCFTSGLVHTGSSIKPYATKVSFPEEYKPTPIELRDQLLLKEGKVFNRTTDSHLKGREIIDGVTPEISSSNIFTIYGFDTTNNKLTLISNRATLRHAYESGTLVARDLNKRTQINATADELILIKWNK